MQRMSINAADVVAKQGEIEREGDEKKGKFNGLVYFMDLI